MGLSGFNFPSFSLTNQSIEAVFVAFLIGQSFGHRRIDRWPVPVAGKRQGQGQGRLDKWIVRGCRARGVHTHRLLVGGLEHGFYDFPYIGNVIIPTDEFIFFRGVGIPPTSYTHIYIYICVCVYSFIGLYIYMFFVFISILFVDR